MRLQPLPSLVTIESVDLSPRGKISSSSVSDPQPAPTNPPNKDPSSSKRHPTPRPLRHPRVPRGWPFPTYPINHIGYADLISQPPNIHHHHHNDDMPFKTGQALTPAYLVCIRILQILLAVFYLIFLSYCGVHRGWWLYLRRSLVLGSASSLASPHFSSIYLPSSPPPCSSKSSPPSTILSPA